MQRCAHPASGATRSGTSPSRTRAPSTHSSRPSPHTHSQVSHGQLGEASDTRSGVPVHHVPPLAVGPWLPQPRSRTNGYRYRLQPVSGNTQSITIGWYRSINGHRLKVKKSKAIGSTQQTENRHHTHKVVCTQARPAQFLHPHVCHEKPHLRVMLMGDTLTVVFT